MTSTIQVRMDAKTKRSVAKIFNELGLDVSTGIKLYFHQVLLHKGIPFELRTANGFTPQAEQDILRESDSTRRLYTTGKRKAHSSIKALMKEVLS